MRTLRPQRSIHEAPAHAFCPLAAPWLVGSDSRQLTDISRSHSNSAAPQALGEAEVAWVHAEWRPSRQGCDLRAGACTAA